MLTMASFATHSHTQLCPERRASTAPPQPKPFHSSLLPSHDLAPCFLFSVAHACLNVGKYELKLSSPPYFPDFSSLIFPFLPCYLLPVRDLRGSAVLDPGIAGASHPVYSAAQSSLRQLRRCGASASVVILCHSRNTQVHCHFPRLAGRAWRLMSRHSTAQRQVRTCCGTNGTGTGWMQSAACIWVCTRRSCREPVHVPSRHCIISMPANSYQSTC